MSGLWLVVFAMLGCALLIVHDRSSLLRAVAGLWTSGSGAIVRPRDSETLFLPQKPFMVHSDSLLLSPQFLMLFAFLPNKVDSPTCQLVFACLHVW